MFSFKKQGDIMGLSDRDGEGFKVEDKRSFNADGSTRANFIAEAPEPPKVAEIKEAPKPNKAPEEEPQFEIDFSTFVVSLASSVQLQLGLVPHPATGKPQLNLAAARQTIEILSLLEYKTRGNLSEREEKILKKVLFDLRMSFVEVSKQQQAETNK